MPYLLFSKKQQILKLSSAANYRPRFMGKRTTISIANLWPYGEFFQGFSCYPLILTDVVSSHLYSCDSGLSNLDAVVD